jgi:gluconokinase
MATTTKLIFAIDIGSSSVRCSAYEISSTGSLKARTNVRTSRVVRSVQPNTGKIQLLGDDTNHDNNKSLMDNLDDCIDELLGILRATNEKVSYKVVAVAFSSFVMNLVGVDAKGQIVGEEASISYACNSPSVARQCKALRR